MSHNPVAGRGEPGVLQQVGRVVEANFDRLRIAREKIAEQRLARLGKPLPEASLDEMEAEWQRVKTEE